MAIKLVNAQHERDTQRAMSAIPKEPMWSERRIYPEDFGTSERKTTEAKRTIDRVLGNYGLDAGFAPQEIGELYTLAPQAADPAELFRL